MNEDKKLQPSDLAGIYKEIAEVIGVESTMMLHTYFQGQQITFPKKLYTRAYIVSQIDCNEIGKNIKAVAKRYGYTERRIRQLFKEQ